MALAVTDAQDPQHISDAGFSGVTHGGPGCTVGNRFWLWLENGRMEPGPPGKEQRPQGGGNGRWEAKGWGPGAMAAPAVPHPHRRPAAAPSAPGPSARGCRVRPRAPRGAAPRFWTWHRLRGETAGLAPGLRPPAPPGHRDVGGTRQAARHGRLCPNSAGAPCQEARAVQMLRVLLLGDGDPLQLPGTGQHRLPHAVAPARHGVAWHGIPSPHTQHEPQRVPSKARGLGDTVNATIGGRPVPDPLERRSHCPRCLGPG